MGTEADLIAKKTQTSQNVEKAQEVVQQSAATIPPPPPNENPIDRYQRLANMTASPLDLDQLKRLSECKTEIEKLCIALSPHLARIDAVKKYVFYGRKPGQLMGLKFDSPSTFVESDLDAQSIRDRVDITHGILGILSEGEELLPALHLLSIGNPTDAELCKILENLKEEVGDVSWYNAIIARGIHVAMSEILNANNRKLIQKRFKGGKYSHEQANNRQLEKELEALNQPHTPPEISVLDYRPAEPAIDKAAIIDAINSATKLAAVRIEKSALEAANRVIDVHNKNIEEQLAKKEAENSKNSGRIAASMATFGLGCVGVAMFGTIVFIISAAVVMVNWLISL